MISGCIGSIYKSILIKNKEPSFQKMTPKSRFKSNMNEQYALTQINYSFGRLDSCKKILPIVDANKNWKD